MSGMDDNVAVIGDWVPPSPSPRTFFSAMLGDDIGAKSPGDYKSEGLFLSAPDRMNLATVANKETRQVSAVCDYSTESGLSKEQRSNSRGCLVERMAARAGFNAPRLNTEGMRSADLSLNPEVRSPYLTIPPGLSPTTLLESPVFLSNSLVQPSPTTGKFPFFPNNTSKGSDLISDTSDLMRKGTFEESNSSFAFKPPVDFSGSSFFCSGSKMTQAMLPQQFSRNEISVQSQSSFQSHNAEQSKVPPHNDSIYHVPTEYSRPLMERDSAIHGIPSQQKALSGNGGGGGPEHSPALDDQADEEGDQRGSVGDPMVGGVGGAPAEDGYNWRKYGQKQVKGSEYPRSYYKCTHPNCPVKKKVERSPEGHITEIIYKGAHNHPKPPANHRSVGGPNPVGDMSSEMLEHNGDPAWANMHKAVTTGASDWRQDNTLEVTSSPSEGPEVGNLATSLQAQNGTHFESADQVDGSSTFSNDEGEDDQQTHGSVSMGYDGDGDESESKRRKIEAYATDMSGATRAIREPRVVVQTTSEVDILDDGYRWRKYGQKVVKGNPNPRSYYKCTSAGCTVRKHVERASHDLKSVITTYEGKHNHDVPAARNSSHVNSSTSSAIPTQPTPSAVQSQVHRPEPSQMQNMMARFEGPSSLGPFNLPGGRAPQLGPSQRFSFGMSQPGLANLAMAGLGPGQGKIPMVPIHPFLMQQRAANEMGFMLPKGEPKAEPVSEPGLNLSNSSAVYQQIMNRLPLGHQM